MVVSGRGHVAVRRQEFATADPARACEVLARAYGSRLRVEATSGATMRHVRYDAGVFSVNEIMLAGRLIYHCEPTETVFVAEVMSGQLRLTCGGRDARLMAGQPILGAHPSTAYVFHAKDARIRQLTMNGQLIGRVAAAERGGPVRFAGFQPPNQALSRLWRETVSFATRVVKSPAAQEPLVLDTAARTLAAAIMTCFPHTVGEDSNRSDETDALSGRLHRAIAFVQTNIDREIGIVDIARAINVTPRSVQLMFRGYLGTTPTGYLRRLRLEHAHRDLIRGEPGTASVGDIAARWGFGHPGRFAAVYRQAYGKAPSNTLRGG
jgi:AraC-like DNA-binding protein